MNSQMGKADKIANAVLYEGYMLYPYRASSIKNRQRCSFGTLYPENHPDVIRGAEPCRNQTQCLLIATGSSTIGIRVRFLHMQSREVEGSSPEREDQSWEEAVERTVDIDTELFDILDRARSVAFEFLPSFEVRNLSDATGESIGRVRKTQLAVSGRIRTSAELLRAPDVFRLTVELVNSTPFAQGSDRTTTLLSVFASAHTVLSVEPGEFVSLLDPPPRLSDAAASCRNIGLYPVLVGERGHNAMLSSPIILYDYPQVAPESAGDFFDATEMDEMLTLRVVTLTEDEKREMRDSDPRMRELLERTEANAREQLARTHGTIRSLRPLKDDAA